MYNTRRNIPSHFFHFLELLTVFQNDFFGWSYANSKVRSQVQKSYLMADRSSVSEFFERYFVPVTQHQQSTTMELKKLILISIILLGFGTLTILAKPVGAPIYLNPDCPPGFTKYGKVTECQPIEPMPEIGHVRKIRKFNRFLGLKIKV